MLVLDHILSFLYHTSFCRRNLHSMSICMIVDPERVEFLMHEYTGNSCFSLVNYFSSVEFLSTNVYWKPTYLPPGCHYFVENVVYNSLF